MAALIGGLKYSNILVNLDLPDGSTSWGYINNDILVKFDSPDGSTYRGLNYCNILVQNILYSVIF